MWSFWTADCHQISAVYVNTSASFTIPAGAAWMAVPGATGPYTWQLY